MDDEQGLPLFLSEPPHFRHHFGPVEFWGTTKEQLDIHTSSKNYKNSTTASKHDIRRITKLGSRGRTVAHHQRLEFINGCSWKN
jgi:hypothetical protein